MLAMWERSPGHAHYDELLTAACTVVYDALSEAMTARTIAAAAAGGRGGDDDIQRASSAGVCILERHMAKLVDDKHTPKLKEV